MKRSSEKHILEELQFMASENIMMDAVCEAVAATGRPY
jgi:glycine/serine hydroxymethyltransferase